MACSIVVALWKDRRIDQTFFKVVELVTEKALVILSYETSDIFYQFIQKDPLISNPVFMVKVTPDEPYSSISVFCNAKKNHGRYDQSNTLLASGKSSAMFQDMKAWAQVCHHYLSERRVNVSYNVMYPLAYRYIVL